MLKRYEDIATVMRRHSIEPAVFVIAAGKDGVVNGMAAGWNVKCSYNPPLIAVAISKNSYTHKLIQETKEFVIAVPSQDQAGQLEYFGSVSGTDVDKFKESGIPTLPAALVKLPLLAEARVNLECKLHSIVPTGDHFLFVGEIVAAHYNSDKDQLYFVGRDLTGNRVFKSIKTAFAEDVPK